MRWILKIPAGSGFVFVAVLNRLQHTKSGPLIFITPSNMVFNLTVSAIYTVDLNEMSDR